MTQATVQPDQPPVPPGAPFFSFSSVVLQVPGRPAPLEMRVSAPATGNNLPLILLSHGHGQSNFLSSMRGYGPLVDFYAAHGFVVIIPTHLNSRTLSLDTSGPEGVLFWRWRATDMGFILDHLAEIQDAVPGLAGRIDTTKVAVIGHSLGGHTAAVLAGMRVQDGRDGEWVDLSEPRIGAAVLISPPADGGDAAPTIISRYPQLVSTDFSTMTTPSLVITGDEDFNPMFSERRDWRADAYRLSPSPKALLTLNDAGHLFGGISGYDAAETSDENPVRVRSLLRITWAYLRSTLYPGDEAWARVTEDLAADPEPQGRIETK